MPAPNTPWVATGAPAGSDHRGGTLRVRYSEFHGLDPADSFDIHAAIWRATGDGLVALSDFSGVAQLVSDLATALPEPTQGGRAYAFILRPGLRYSTGTPVRPSDVRRGLERLFALRSDAAPMYAALRGAAACARRPEHCDLSAGVVTDDAAGTVILRLTRPDPELLFKLTSPAARPVPPGTPRTRLASEPVASTGPYRPASLVPGRRLLLERNPWFHEWSRAAQPSGYPDRIDIRMQTDPARRVQGVLRGGADLALEVASAAPATLRTRFPSQLRRHAQPHASFLLFNVRQRPFDDARARRAVNLALDRAAIARRYALRRIGYRPRINIVRSLPKFDRRIADVAGGWNLSSGDWIADWPSPGEFFDVFLTCSSYRPGDPTLTRNAGGFCDPRLDRLVARAQRLQITDPVKAERIWAAADHRAVDRAAWAPMVSNAAVELLSKRVGHFTLANSQPQIDQLWVR